MNESLQRYLDFRRMMVRQAKAQRNGSVQALGAGGAEVRELRERLLLERSALLEQAAEQVEAMRLTLKAVRHDAARS